MVVVMVLARNYDCVGRAHGLAHLASIVRWQLEMKSKGSPIPGQGLNSPCLLDSQASNQREAVQSDRGKEHVGTSGAIDISRQFVTSWLPGVATS